VRAADHVERVHMAREVELIVNERRRCITSIGAPRNWFRI